MSARIIGPITININQFVNQRIYNVVFGATDFHNALQYTLIQGPFSMAVDVNNTSGFDLYIGVTIRTLEQNIVIADRKHLIFCPFNSHVTLSGASIPALAEVHGEVIEVTITLYRMNNLAGGVVNTTVSVALFLDDAFIPTGPPPYIGIDTTAFQPGNYDVIASSGFSNIIANTAGTLFITSTSTLVYRKRILSVILALQPTPFPMDTVMFATISNIGLEFARIFSETDRVVSYIYDKPVEIRNGETINIYVDNNNPSNNYKGYAAITFENIY